MTFDTSFRQRSTVRSARAARTARPVPTWAWALTLVALAVATGCGPNEATGAGTPGAAARAATTAATAPAGTVASASAPPVNSATANAAAALPAVAAVSASSPDMALNCDESSVTTAGKYMAENNSWGRQGVVGWKQCMGAATNARGGLSARWTWDWRYQGDNVKAYPEVVFGHKPGYPKSTTPLLPRALGSLQQLTLDYEVATEREGAGNLAIDMWVTSTPNPVTFDVPTITHEVMIWLEVFGPMYAGGQQVDKVRINGTQYRVFVGEKFGLGWRYIAFAPNSPMQTTTRMDLLPFFAYLQQKNLIGPNDHLAAVNLGNEIISGAGDTRLHHFAVSVR